VAFSRDAFRLEAAFSRDAFRLEAAFSRNASRLEAAKNLTKIKEQGGGPFFS
jgi:hypothetical protein